MADPDCQMSVSEMASSTSDEIYICGNWRKWFPFFVRWADYIFRTIWYSSYPGRTSEGMESGRWKCIISFIFCNGKRKSGTDTETAVGLSGNPCIRSVGSGTTGVFYGYFHCRNIYGQTCVHAYRTKWCGETDLSGWRSWKFFWHKRNRWNLEMQMAYEEIHAAETTKEEKHWADQPSLLYGWLILWIGGKTSWGTFHVWKIQRHGKHFQTFDLQCT